MADDDYTLLSSKEVSELKQDIDYLKKNPLGGSASGRTLQESIEKLNENMRELIEIFKEASDMMKAEERESDVIIKRIEPIERKLDELSDQNQKIAKGILAIADMVSEKEKSRPQPQIQPRPMQYSIPQMPRPSMSRPEMAPQMPKPMMSQGLSAPPIPSKKKGFLGFIKK